ncbi:HD-GYP domain-containing protein [Bacillus cereus]|nr:HD-GYP domain-containing protein [Bacillus cereus]
MSLEKMKELIYINKSKSLESQEKNILILMKFLEIKDPYTKRHCERVAKYAKLLAKETNLYNKEALDDFYLACLLHDIGKIGVPDEILNKKGPLSKDEYHIIKTHTELGFLLSVIFEFSAIYKETIRSHHEKWDGTGYPDGLKKTEIPLSARIVSLADAFDAMTSTRVYRRSLSPEAAYKLMLKGAGTQFDPALVKTFKIVYPLWSTLIDT